MYVSYINLYSFIFIYIMEKLRKSSKIYFLICFCLVTDFVKLAQDADGGRPFGTVWDHFKTSSIPF